MTVGVLAVLVVAVAVAAQESVTPPVSTSVRSGDAAERTAVAYSFHGTLRCTTCLLVEQGPRQRSGATSPTSLRRRSLVWRSVNIRLPENRHFAVEYDVASWALVLVEDRGDRPGKWRKLSLAGELVHADPAAFRRYVTAEVRAFLANDRQMTGEIR